MQPPAGETCGTYLTPFANRSGGSIYNPSATSDCQYCTESNANQFLSAVAISYSTRWRDYGIGFAYIGFNIFMAVLLYSLIRVRKGSGRSLKERVGKLGFFFKNDSKEEKNTTEKRKEAPHSKGGSMIPER
jgi:ATP-binding cassette subfamily G (WHITE) protein 2 (PDR)